MNVTLKLAWMAPGVTGEKVMGTLMEEKGADLALCYLPGETRVTGPLRSMFP